MPFVSAGGRAIEVTASTRPTVFDLFGDYVRYDGGEISLQALADLLATFGTTPDVTRVVVSRLKQDGWIDVRREGRRSVVTASQEMWRTLVEGRPRIFERPRDDWDGRWRLVIYTVPETERATRERLRRTLSWLGFGPLSASVWMCPHDRLAQVAAGAGELPGVRLDLLTASSQGEEQDREIAGRCWDLDGLNGRYRRFLERWAVADPGFLERLSDTDAFVLRVALNQEYRQFPFQDPGLPARLLPPDWAGRPAHERFVELHDRLEAPASRRYVAATRMHPVAVATSPADRVNPSLPSAPPAAP
jgi:phenylacetic acid degradation operon negative regulatory protein